MVAQELLAYQDPFAKNELYFWSRDLRNAQAELDFVIQIKGQIVPIEVKSGPAGKLKSLAIFLAERKLQFGVKISTAPLSTEASVLNLPIYMIKQLPRLWASLK